ncbi:MAG: hypothetical protein Q9218_001058, partial [Villophora microphyllina]
SLSQSFDICASLDLVLNFKAGNMVELKLNFAPARPSRLRHVDIPRSPASPLESIAKRLQYALPTVEEVRETDSPTATKDPPPSPYKWMWYCHQCRTGYGVGVTRRCLIDDHVLCYGATIKRKSKRPKRVRACQSEFDYNGWQNWGAWKRSQAGNVSQHERNCFDNCDWPSQCRWAPKQQEQPAGPTSKEIVQEAAHEAPATSSNAAVISEVQPTDNVFAKLSSATQKLASHWSSMLKLTPVEAEELGALSPTSLEGFLKQAKASMDITDTDNINDSSAFFNVPSIAPLTITKSTTSTENPALTTEEAQSEAPSGSFTNFDFGFRNSKEVDSAPPSIAEGIVASIIGIAISAVPSVQVQEGIMEQKSRRCISEPLPTLSVWLQERVRERRRRVSSAM